MKTLFDRDGYEREVWERDESETEENLTLIDLMRRMINRAGCVEDSDEIEVYYPQ